MAETRKSRCVQRDVLLSLESVAVGPYCVLNDPRPPKSSPTDKLRRTSVPSDSHTPKNMDGIDYSYLEGMHGPWPATSSDGMHYTNAHVPGASQNGALANGNWEEFMQWNPAHSQGRGVRQNSHKSALYNRRSESVIRDPSLGLPSTETTQGPLTAPSSLPLTFGESVSNGPNFVFSPNTLVSPATTQTQHAAFPRASTWQAQSPLEQSGSEVVSPLSYESQRPFGNAEHIQKKPMAAPSLHHSSESTNVRTSPSASESESQEKEAPAKNIKKRKSQSSEYERSASGKPGPVKKIAHNMIEKRYRTNLNDKIAALRDSVPSLRVMSRQSGDAEVDDDGEDLGGLTPAHKLNKATVLSKATEYIRHLEKRNKKLQDELTAVKNRLDSYEKMTMGVINTPDSMSRFQDDPFSRATPNVSSAAHAPPQGMIPVPENIMALHRASVNQPHYANSNAGGYQRYGPVSAQPGMAGQHPMVNGRPSNIVNKLMVGSLAGLMLMEGFSERDQSGEAPEGRGLFTVPFTLLRMLANFLLPRTAIFGMSPYDALAALKIFMIFGTFGYLITPLLDFRPRPKTKNAPFLLSPAPSLASPVEVRRKAWLTAIQTVWVPRHSFLLEVAALLLKTLKLSTRKLIGWNGYSMLTGITKDQEIARVKAWEIALDAQLTGGDAEISISRLVLTLMASGTLPDTPARLMLKALHIRVLLWEVAKAGYGTWYMFDEISQKLARSYWNAARNEHKMLVNNSGRESDASIEPLPEHLACLLELESNQVLVDSIIQRANDLAWNHPSAEIVTPDESMDSVVEDFAISSPLDALAAWWSSLKLNNVLSHSLRSGVSQALASDLELVMRIAPPTSGSQMRALVAKAVLVRENRMEHVSTAHKALPNDRDIQSHQNELSSPHALLNAISQAPISTDVRIALSLSKCLALAETSSDDLFSKVAHQRAIQYINMYRPLENSFSLLSFVASFGVLDLFSTERALLNETRPALEFIVNSMRVWIGRESGRSSGITSKTRSKCVERCVSASKMLVGVAEIDSDESDAGYVSQEEDRALKKLFG